MRELLFKRGEIMEKLETIIAGEICMSKEPGASMKKWREIFGVSQTELAEVLKVSSSTISDYEGGRRKSPGIGVVSRLVETLIEMDRKHGGKVTKQLERDFKPREELFNTHEFFASMPAKEFAQKIGAECIANPSKIKEMQIYGYTIIDSLKAILDIPVQDYIQLFGKTPERALIFTQVESGRSPMIAVKVGRFSTEMRPSIVVLHGPAPDKVDHLAVKIAEAEKIPLLVTQKPLDEIAKILKEFEN